MSEKKATPAATTVTLSFCADKYVRLQTAIQSFLLNFRGLSASHCSNFVRLSNRHYFFLGGCGRVKTNSLSEDRFLSKA